MIRRYKKILLIISFALSFFCFTSLDSVSANSNTLLFGGQENQVGNAIGLGDEDPRIIIANVIRITLGFLGIIAVILIMYAGWLYMTASGEEDKIEQAKKILIGAVIGLAIILASFALATFVLNRLYDVSGSGGGGGCNPPCLSGYCCTAGSCSACGLNSPGVSLTSSISPPDGSDYYPMNTIGQVRFNKNVDTASGNFNDGGQNLSNYFTSDNRLEFVNQATCSGVAAGTNIIIPNAWQNKNCFDPSVDYTVTVGNYQSATGNQTLNCTTGCVSNFRVAPEIDIDPPEININQTAAMCANYDIEISATARDNFGVSEMSFYIYNASNAEIFQASSSPASLSRRFSDTVSLSNIISSSGQYSVRVLAVDIAGNLSEEQQDFTVWPDHCCNNELDGVGDADLIDPNRPETDIDCGGECGVCEGGACAIDMTLACTGGGGVNCSTNLCSDSLLCNCENNNGSNCTDAGYLDINGDPYQINNFLNCCICRNWPVIDNVSPSGGGICVNAGSGLTNNQPCLSNDNCSAGEICDLSTLRNIPNGAIGSMVTISGRNFGINPGEVYFCSNMGAQDCLSWSMAELAESVNQNCVNSWSDTRIIAVVPSGAVGGPIRVVTDNGFEELTNDDWGKNINDFVVNGFQRPGVCLVENNNVSGQVCSLDDDCTPYECISESLNKACLKNQGYFEETINYQGIGLENGTIANFGDFYDGYEEAYNNSSAFSGLAGTAQVPNIQNRKTSTFVINNNLLSNNYDFYKIGGGGAEPRIIYFDPVFGRDGQYITIHGQGFGNPSDSQIGVNYKVFFDSNLAGNDISDETTLGTPANFDFPGICRQNGLWKDDSILIKAPELNNNDNYYLVIKIDNRIELIDSSDVDDSIGNYEKTFLYNDAYPLTPGLCAIIPRSGQRSSEFSIFGEGLGDQQSHRVLFGDISINNNFTFATVGDAQRITSFVPEQVADGYNQVSASQRSATACVSQADCNDGWSCLNSECQALGNSLPFKVGACSGDSECGAGYFCCDEGSFAETCQAGSDKDDACYKTFSSCVYEFDFNTGSSSTSTSTIESCIGYGASECGYNFCPNSPGWCSFNTSPGEITNNCDTPYCDNLHAGSTYSSDLNRCVDGNQCDLNEKFTVDYNNQSYEVEKYCDTYNGNDLWHYQLSGGTCEIPESTFNDGITNWTNIGDNTCIHLNENCDKCDDGLSCLDDGGDGVCAYDGRVCASGYTCNGTNQCERDAGPCCDCCCDINKNSTDVNNPGNPGCCAPLECDFDCGEGGRDNNNDGDFIDPGDNDFGLCTGCTVRDAGGNIDIDASDSACNCSESDISGKYCDTAAADDKGVCRDCASLQDNTDDCSDHNTCCVDNKDSDNCRGVGSATVQDLGINYCAYYSCGDDGTGNEVCLGQAPTRDGDYLSDDCNNACGINGSRMGASCYIRNDNLGINECTYDFCPDFNCLNPDGNEAFLNSQTCTNGGDPSAQNCGICCCDPNAADDKCTIVDASLSCLANVSPCGGDYRGMCCGCSEDSDCSIGDPDNIGCGDDSCCRARPLVESYYPGNDETGVCRNTLIQATFNQKMDEGSLEGNLIVVGDYGLDSCPASTTYLVYQNGEFKQSNFIARAFKKLINSVVRPLIGKNAFAANNFCAISGSTSNSYNPLSDETTIDFNLNNLLDANRDYYVIIKGDNYLNSSSGVLNFWGIGMVENNPTLISSTNGFNGLDFTNAKIWKFTAGDAICALDSVDVIPDDYVFKLDESDITVLGKTQDFTALALNSQGELISNTAEYDWTWDWIIDNPQVIDFQTGQLPSDNPQTVVAQNQQDASTYINAEAVISTAPTDMINSIGRNVTGRELVHVFACNNPWPPITNGGWQPWVDTNTCTQNLGDCINTNYEIYYCRDGGDFGTADDLPAILSNTVSVGHPIDNNVIKESYFFREEVPDQTGFLVGASVLEGGGVNLTWGDVDVPAGETLATYKVYYGESSGDYTESIITNDVSPNFTVMGLVNEKKYYFTVTAIFESGAESEYSVEAVVSPHDSQGPIPPTINEVTAGNGEVNIDWEDASNGDAVAFRIYYTALAAGEVCDANTSFGGSISVPYSTGDVTTVSDLNTGTEYCFGMVGYDASGNSSAVSTINPIIPEDTIASPNNLLVVPGNQEANLSWSPVDNAEQYKIYVGTTIGTYNEEYLTYNDYYKLTNLSNGQQYFLAVSARSYAGTESLLSEVTVIPSSNVSLIGYIDDVDFVIDLDNFDLSGDLNISFDVVN